MNMHIPMMVILAIEFGETHSRVGMFINGTAHIFTNNRGENFTSNYVSYTDKGPVVGFPGKELAAGHPKNTIFNFRQLLGKNFSNPETQQHIKTLPYDVVMEDGRPTIKLSIKGKTKHITPEEVASEIFKELKTQAENHLSTKFQHALVTVPFYFNDIQRQQIKDAGTLAGLNVIRILNEPVVAGIAHYLDKTNQELEFIVYDLGETAFDVSVISAENGVFEVLSSVRDTHFGTRDLEDAFLNYVVEQFDERHHLNPRENFEVLEDLRTLVKQAKKELLTNPTAKITLPEMVNVPSKFLSFAQRDLVYDSLAALFFKIAQLTHQALDETASEPFDWDPYRQGTKVQKVDINGIILTGDPVYTALLHSYLENFFDGQKVLSEIPSNETIIRGAAIQADVLLSESGTSNCPPLMDVNPLSVGIEASDGTFLKVILRNTIIPTRKTIALTTARDDQAAMFFKIYEGERLVANKNNLIGMFALKGIKAAPKGVPEIELSFDFDVNYALKVSALYKKTGNQEFMVFPDRELKQEDIYRMVEEAEEKKDEDIKSLEMAVKDHQMGVEDPFGVQRWERTQLPVPVSHHWDHAPPNRLQITLLLSDPTFLALGL
ncbi:hypothetical protein G7Y89_g13669 [Cudoniella acicularis]|uniref:non-chaperonin molecular chaperone ATPase n=1 Tax=Cudoniella acicularis TaxID=354080 RepID=A0A8H4R6T5_9HELO|nr:hypothetical protein G7Y89_g13669 [Cudoniella acicularis]